jgi:hypothetical protein
MVKNLALSEWNAGSVTYEPRGRDVRFRVEVSAETANASGSVQVVNLATPPAVTAARPPDPLLTPIAKYPAAELRPSKTLPTPAETAAAPVAEDKPKEEIPTTASQSSAGTETFIKRDATPSIDFDKVPRPPLAEGAAVPVPIPKPSVRVWTEPVADSPWGRVVRKVPLVRRLRKPAKTSMPAPIFQAQPVLTSSLKQSFTEPVSVDIRVDVGDTGLVERAEVIEFSDPLNVALTNSALAAAVRWTFEPARSEDLAVSSKVILHFRFTP